MKRRALLLSLVPLLMSATLAVAAPEAAAPAPAFTHARADDWLNTPPLAWSALKGKVVLVEFWAFECWNCERSLPWLQSLEKKFPAHDFTLIGVHTPELESERVRGNVLQAVAKNRITFPVMLDNDYSYWIALKNQYWPAFYLVDRQGRLRASFAGETHPGDERAQAIESAIGLLLAERP